MVEAYLDGCDQSENVDACTFVLDNNLSGTVEGNITMVAKENIFNPSDGEKYRSCVSFSNLLLGRRISLDNLRKQF